MDIIGILINGTILIFVFYFLAKVVDEIFIKSLDNISHFLKLPPSVSGATFMAAGTSAPELSTTMFALFLAGANPATGLGTVVGSAIFQILVVIGFAALVKTSYLNWKPVIRDGIFYTFSIIILIFVIRDGNIRFEETLFMVGTYFIYLFILLLWSKFVNEANEPDPIDLLETGLEKNKTTPNNFRNPISFIRIIFLPIDLILKVFPDAEKNKKWTIPIFILSLVGIAFGSYWLVFSGERLALALSIPPAIIALTILAGGTSIPELISSAIVAREGRGDMAISNAIGSNIFDILISLGLPLLIFTGFKGDLEGIDAENVNSSVILLFFTLIMVLLLLVSQKFKVGKIFGGILIFFYIIYVIAAYIGLLD